MIALDTNVVLRIVLADDHAQHDAATRLLEQSCFVPVGVLLEAGWVLESAYQMPRRQLANALSGLIAHPMVAVPDFDRVVWALERYATARSDLADLLHLASSAPADRFVTFDRKLPSQAGEAPPMPIAVIV